MDVSPSAKRKLVMVYLQREREKDVLDNCLMKAKQAKCRYKKINLCLQFVRKQFSTAIGNG